MGLIATASSLLVDNPAFLCATLGYAGHNWELYALWQWYSAFALERGLDFGMEPERGAALTAFTVVAAGCFGSIGGGLLADRIGRTTVCLVALFASLVGSCTSGWLDDPVLLHGVGVVWGVFAIADSAQYSAMVSELVPKRQVGTAITFQFGFGFIFTVPGMYIVPLIGAWGPAWLSLAPGTAIAMAAMWRLRQLPAAAVVSQRLGRPQF